MARCLVCTLLCLGCAGAAAGLRSRGTAPRTEVPSKPIKQQLEEKLDRFRGIHDGLQNATHWAKQVFTDLTNTTKQAPQGNETAPGLQNNWTKWTWWNGRKYKTMLFYHMHIPRTGGSSFVVDAPREVLNNLTLSMVSKEGCYNWRKRLPGVDEVVTMVRNPRSHVLSQFLYCAHGSIHMMTQVHKFVPWLEAWTKTVRKGELVGDFASRSQNSRQLLFHKYVTHTFLPFHCYSPVNLMVQHFTCRGHPFNYTKQDRTSIAIENMKSTFFVGITEAYQESMCLFHAKVHDSLPEWCDCTNRTAWHKFKSSHTSYYIEPMKEEWHSVDNWKPETRQMVDNLTRGDMALYQASLHRFAREIHAAEQRFNTTIMCNDRLLQQSQMEDLAQRDFSLFMREARATLKVRL
mmetsp:Transcript_20215/g.63324  ORF Transcript_20215/g.63324 Transcript_20215/m.63324 type:complete len:405 (-) Transcript_20215:295-1509(-)